MYVGSGWMYTCILLYLAFYFSDGVMNVPIIYFATQMLNLDFVNILTTLPITYQRMVLCVWLHLKPCFVQPPTNLAVRIEDIGIIQIELLSLPARMGHFSSHLELTKEE